MYALANSLVGFRSSTLRVIVREVRDGCAWITTADLSDAGTKLVIDASQISLIPGESVVIAKDWTEAQRWIDAIVPAFAPAASTVQIADGSFRVTFDVVEDQDDEPFDEAAHAEALVRFGGPFAGAQAIVDREESARDARRFGR